MLNNLDINEIWPKDNDMMQIGGEEIENLPMNMVLKGIVFLEIDLKKHHSMPKQFIPNNYSDNDSLS
jgi:hypothetical protein